MTKSLLSLACLMASIASAQDAAPRPPASSGGKVVRANYDLASRWTAAKTNKIIFDLSVAPHWLESGDRFWYSFETGQGRRFWMIDPVRKTKVPVFDAVKLAALLTGATGLPYDSQHLPMRTLKFVKGDTAIQFDITVPINAVIPGEKKPDPPATAGVASTTASATPPYDEDDPQQRRAGVATPPKTTKIITYEYELAANKLTIVPEKPPAKPRWASVSPDDKTVVFARNHNLYMMDAANFEKAKKKPTDTTIVETQITKDGIEDFSYQRRAGFDVQQLQLQQDDQEQQQTDSQDKNARMPMITIYWSQDSKRFSVIRQDERKVQKLWVINSLAAPRPKLETYAYGMPGEAEQPQGHLEVFTLAGLTRGEVKAELWKDQTLSVVTALPSARAREREKSEAQWAVPGSEQIYFLRTSRDLHRVDVCVANASTGEAKTIIEERANIYVDVQPLRVFANGSQLLWWSERDGWGHYYLYGSDGKLKKQVTQGEFVTGPITAIDEKTDTILLTANGREAGEDPAYTHEYRVNLETNAIKLLDPGNYNHSVAVADSGHYFVDTFSRVNTSPESVLYDATGAKVMDLDKTDMARALQAGFKFPETFQVKADDGVTDLYGVLYKPFDFDPAKKYPVIAYVYPGPQQEGVTKLFSPRNGNVMLANLGFIVVEVGNRGGTPQRSKWYHTYGYTNLRDYGLADKKAGIEQLAARFPFIDLDRVGITGHSGGGFMSTAAMLIYPDFFKVAVSESGNHENDIYNRWWSEKHDGVREVTDKDGKVHFEYDIDRNSEIVKNLKGHLMLATGDIDNNVHPANTIRLIDALIKANKRFDFVLLPGQRHAYGPVTEYFQWLRADYFCKYLLGDFDQSVDMWELNREKPQDNKAPGAPRRIISSGQQEGTRQAEN